MKVVLFFLVRDVLHAVNEVYLFVLIINFRFICKSHCTVKNFNGSRTCKLTVITSTHPYNMQIEILQSVELSEHE